MSKEVADALGAASDIAKAASAAPGPAGIVASITSIALKAAQGIAQAGGDPVVEIQRILGSDKGVQEIHEDWNEWILRNFRQSVPPPTPDPDTEPYEGHSGVDKKDTQPSMPAISKEDLLDSDPPIDIYDEAMNDGEEA